MTTKERIAPVQAFELDIIKKIKENGEIFYDHPVHEDEPGDDKAIEVYEQQLFDMIGCMLEKFKILFSLLDPQEAPFIFLGDVIINDSMHQLYEIFDILDNKFGQIYCHVVSHGNLFYRQGRVVGITIKKPRDREKSQK